MLLKYLIKYQKNVIKLCSYLKFSLKKGNPSSLTDASVAAEVAFAGLRGGV